MKILCSLLCLALLASTYPSALADDVAPSHRAAAEELLKMMRLDQMMAKQMEQTKQMMGNVGASATGTSVTPERKAEMAKTQADVMDMMAKKMSWESLKPEFVQAYVETFSEPEIKDLIAFYQSPVGQKFLDKQPILNAKIMQITQKRVMELMPEIQSMSQRHMQGAGAPGSH